jgi:hypothetical protein
VLAAPQPERAIAARHDQDRQGLQDRDADPQPRARAASRQLLDELEVSPATLKRDLEFLRDRLGAPIEYDRDLNAYRFGAGATAARSTSCPACGSTSASSTAC